MARQSRHRKQKEEHILPLINIVFLLLIFFMVAGRLTTSDSVGINPPRSSSRAFPDPQVLTLSIDRDGELALNGVAVKEGEVGPAVARQLALEARTVPVVLEADAAVDAVTVVAVMAMLSEAGVSDLQLLTMAGDR